MYRMIIKITNRNKANLGGLIAATGLVILIILDFSAYVALKFDGWRKQIIGHLS